MGNLPEKPDAGADAGTEKPKGDGGAELRELDEDIKYAPREIGAADIIDAETIRTDKSITALEVGATWCGPCQELGRITPTINRIFNTQVAILKLTIDNNKEYGEILKKMSAVEPQKIPTILFFRNGKILESPKVENGDIFEIVKGLEESGMKMGDAERRELEFGIAKKSPRSILSDQEKISEKNREECAKLAAVTAAKTDPFVTFEIYRKNPGLVNKTILEVAARKSLRVTYGNNNHSITFEECDVFIKEPYAREVLLDAFAALPKDETVWTTISGSNGEIFKKYAQEKFAMEILSMGASGDPMHFIFDFEKILPLVKEEDKTKANEIFVAQVEFLAGPKGDPVKFMLALHEILGHVYIGKPDNYGVKLMDALIAKNPKAGIIFPNHYQHLPNAKNRLTSSLDRVLASEPGAIFERFEFIFYHCNLLTAPEKISYVKKACRSKKGLKAAFDNLGNITRIPDDEFKEKREILQILVGEASRRDPSLIVENAANLPKDEFFTIAIKRATKLGKRSRKKD